MAHKLTYTPAVDAALKRVRDAAEVITEDTGITERERLDIYGRLRDHFGFLATDQENKLREHQT